MDLCERIRTRVAREAKKHVEVVCCYEAGYDGFWLHRLLEAHGIRNYVIDPASLQVDRRAPVGACPGMIKTIETERDAIAAAKTEAVYSRDKKDPGSGQDQEHRARICPTLVGEVFYRSFDNRKQLASYVGLTPAHFQSGPTCRDQKQGR